MRNAVSAVTFITATALFPVTAPVVAHAADCPEVEVVFARGTTGISEQSAT